MGGSAFVTGTIVAAGVIRQTGTYQQMTFGELDGQFGAGISICALSAPPSHRHFWVASLHFSIFERRAVEIPD